MLRSKVTLTEKTELDTDLYKIVFALPDDTQIDFAPGQFMSLAVEGNVRRSFSLSNPPADNNVLETYADVSPHGPAFRFFSKAQLGDTVDVLAPLGRFTYIQESVPAYFLGTGTGIVPFISMVQHELEGLGSSRPLYLYSGARTPQRLIGDELLKKLALEYERFSYFPYVSQLAKAEESGIPAGDFKTGRMTSDISELKDLSAHYYLCGGQDVIAELEKMLLANDIPASNIFYERFY